MGRITQTIDFINQKHFPSHSDREIFYTKISDWITLKRLRKELNLQSNIENDEEPDLFS